MEPLDSLRQVAEFHRTFHHPVLPGRPFPERCQLRVNLIAEELDELRHAIEHQDLVGIADALCDIQYVLSGAVLEFGMGYKFKALFDEVQRSNMSKSCNSAEEAEATANTTSTATARRATFAAKAMPGLCTAAATTKRSSRSITPPRIWRKSFLTNRKIQSILFSL